MFLVVGLGNPGKEYDGTRHNVGYEVVRKLASDNGFPPTKQAKKALVQKGTIRGKDVMLAQPTTYMNLSGDAVSGLTQYYKVEPENVVVVHDELDFEPGLVRVKRGGGHGGHNGLRSIMSHVGRDFPRVRIGIGKPRHAGADHVLSRFSKAERPIIDEAIECAASVVESIVVEGLEAAMQQYNGRNNQGDSQE